MDFDEAEPRNGEYYLEARRALGRINGRAIFDNIHTRRPLYAAGAGNGGGGAQAHDSQQHFYSALAAPIACTVRGQACQFELRQLSSSQ
jgi:hypothetical protein